MWSRRSSGLVRGPFRFREMPVVYAAGTPCPRPPSAPSRHLADPGSSASWTRLIRARYPLVYLVSSEEARVDELLRGHRRGARQVAHRLVRGARAPPPRRDPRRRAPGADRGALRRACRRSAGCRNPRWSSSRTSTPGSTTAGSSARSASSARRSRAATPRVLVLAPVLQLPVELEKEIAVLDVPLPTFAELADLLRDIVGVLRKAGRVDRGPQAGGGRAADQGRPGPHPPGGGERLRQGHRRRRPAGRHRHPAGDGREAPGHPQERAARVLPGGSRRWPRSAGSRASRTGCTGAPAPSPPRPAPSACPSRTGSCSSASRAAARASPPRPSPPSGRCRCSGSTWAGSSAGWSARARRTSAGPSASPRAPRPAVLWLDEIDKALSGSASSERERRRHHRPGVRHLPHLAAGEDRAGVRGRHRQPRRGAPARAAPQGALRRDLLHRPARRRRAPGDPPHPPRRAAAARRRRSTSPGSPPGPSSSAAPSWSRRWSRVSTPRSTPAPSSPTRTSPRPSPRPCPSPSPCARRSPASATGPPIAPGLPPAGGLR